ncbi:hypothetical protein VTO73DRAFT_7277 [Trametes versicolor]
MPGIACVSADVAISAGPPAFVFRTTRDTSFPCSIGQRALWMHSKVSEDRPKPATEEVDTVVGIAGGSGFNTLQIRLHTCFRYANLDAHATHYPGNTQGTTHPAKTVQRPPPKVFGAHASPTLQRRQDSLAPPTRLRSTKAPAPREQASDVLVRHKCMRSGVT